MNRATFMAIAAVIALGFGLAFILVPAQVSSFYGNTLEAVGQWVGRYFGSALIGIAVLNWLAKNAPQGEALSAVVLGDFVLSLIGLGVALLEALFGTGNALRWFTVAIYLFLTLGFGYFQFIKPSAS